MKAILSELRKAYQEGKKENIVKALAKKRAAEAKQGITGYKVSFRQHENRDPKSGEFLYPIVVKTFLMRDFENFFKMAELMGKKIEKIDPIIPEKPEEKHEEQK